MSALLSTLVQSCGVSGGVNLQHLPSSTGGGQYRGARHGGGTLVRLLPHHTLPLQLAWLPSHSRPLLEHKHTLGKCSVGVVLSEFAQRNKNSNIWLFIIQISNTMKKGLTQKLVFVHRLV